MKLGVCKKKKMLKNIVKESDHQNKELLTLSNLISKNNNNKCE